MLSRILTLLGGALLLVLFGGLHGCGPAKPKEIVVAPAYNNLRNLTLAYMQATNALGHPPANADELKPYLAKVSGGDPNELLKSPIDGTDLVIHWGANLKNLKPQGSDYPVWIYEKNPHDGKRWVVQERNPVELTEEQFRTSLFAPGFKKPF